MTGDVTVAGTIAVGNNPGLMSTGSFSLNSGPSGTLLVDTMKAVTGDQPIADTDYD